LGSHPTEDLELTRYAYPNNTWDGLGDPLQNRQVNKTNHLDDSTLTTDMYVIDTGDGTVINLGIDRSVSSDILNATALAEGSLPDGVELYGPGWKSEYDIDEEDDDTLAKRGQLFSLNPSKPHKYRAFDLSRHLLSSEEVKNIFNKHNAHEEVLTLPSPAGTPMQEDNEIAQAVGSSVGITIMIFFVAVLAFLLVRKRRRQHGKRYVMLGGISSFDSDASDVSISTSRVKGGLRWEHGAETYMDVDEVESV